MPCTIKNPANIDLSELEGLVQDLYTHVYNRVGFNKPPTMVFDSDPQNQANILGKTAYYDPNSLEIHVFTDGRHPKDMLRSIAHELIHHWQNEEGRLDVGGYSGPGYYLKNKDLKKLEDEAMLLGNGYFREFEDNLKLKEKKEMSLNEWKNNELNKLLLKKFGLLKEYKNPDSVQGRVGDESDDEFYKRINNPGKEEEEQEVSEDKSYNRDDDEVLDEEKEVVNEGPGGHKKVVLDRIKKADCDELKSMNSEHFSDNVKSAYDAAMNKCADGGEKEVMDEGLQKTVQEVLNNNKKLRLRFK